LNERNTQPPEHLSVGSCATVLDGCEPSGNDDNVCLRNVAAKKQCGSSKKIGNISDQTPTNTKSIKTYI